MYVYCDVAVYIDHIFPGGGKSRVARSEGGEGGCVDAKQQGRSSDGSEEASLQETVPRDKAQQQLPLPFHFHDDGGCGMMVVGVANRSTVVIVREKQFWQGIQLTPSIAIHEVYFKFSPLRVYAILGSALLHVCVCV